MVCVWWIGDVRVGIPWDLPGGIRGGLGDSFASIEIPQGISQESSGIPGYIALQARGSHDIRQGSGVIQSNLRGKTSIERDSSQGKDGVLRCKRFG